MTTAIIWRSALELLAGLIVVASLAVVGFVLICIAHDAYVAWRNPHGIPQAHPPRRARPRRLDRWEAVPVLGIFLTHGHPNGWTVFVPVALFMASWWALAVLPERRRRRRFEQRAAHDDMLIRIRLARVGCNAAVTGIDRQRTPEFTRRVSSSR